MTVPGTNSVFCYRKADCNIVIRFFPQIKRLLSFFQKNDSPLYVERKKSAVVDIYSALVELPGCRFSLQEQCILSVRQDAQLSDVIIKLAKAAALELCKGVQAKNCEITLRPSTQLKVSEHCKLSRAIIFLNDAKVDLCSGVLMDHCRIVLQPGGKLRLGKNCILKHVNITIGSESDVIIAENVRIIGREERPISLKILNGKAVIDHHALIQSDILVRFGGQLSIGDHTGLSSSSELRCEERITIGSYCLISYNVTIFDTNTHSTDWQERRAAIERGFPAGAHEIEKPQTKPIVIGDDVWIGKGVAVLKGTELGDRAIIGLGAVVHGMKIPPNAKVVNQKPLILEQ